MMRKISLLLICIIALFAFKQPTDFFTGKIIYKYQFTDAKGNDITGAMAEFTGKEQHYFINGRNYKAYDEKGNLQQLYNSDSNSYYQIAKNKSGQKIDASIPTSKIFTLNKLDIKEEIAGYTCSAIEVITDDATTTYFYTPSVKVSPAVYQKHNFGEWNKVLQATDGALPLKFKMINKKMGSIVWVSTAIQISKQKLPDNLFELPADIKISGN
jgi:hypothetical protein